MKYQKDVIAKVVQLFKPQRFSVAIGSTDCNFRCNLDKMVFKSYSRCGYSCHHFSTFHHIYSSNFRTNWCDSNKSSQTPVPTSVQCLLGETKMKWLLNQKNEEETGESMAKNETISKLENVLWNKLKKTTNDEKLHFFLFFIFWCSF